LLFHCREAALLLVVEEKNVPRTVRVVTPIALWAMTLLAIPHDIDTLTVWTMNLYIGHSILLYEQGQRCHSISMSTHLKHHRGCVCSSDYRLQIEYKRGNHRVHQRQ